MVVLTGRRFCASPIRPRAEVCLDALMLDPVESIALEQLLQRSTLRGSGFAFREDPVDDVLQHSSQRGVGSGRGGKMFQLRPFVVRQRARILPQERRYVRE